MRLILCTQVKIETYKLTYHFSPIPSDILKTKIQIADGSNKFTYTNRT